MTIEEFFDKIFLINLASRKDRLGESVDELERGGVDTDYVERFNAFWNADEKHAGCTKSHRYLIRKIANGPWDKVAIFEDDIQAVTLPVLKEAGFTPESQVWKTFCTVMDGQGTLNERFNYLSKFIPEAWDVLYLGAGYGEPPISRFNEHVIRCGFMQTTSSYGITRELARIWDEKVNAIVGSSDLDRHPGPIDNLFGRLAKDHLFYVFQPRLIFQRKSRSDITGETNSYLNSMTDPIHEGLV